MEPFPSVEEMSPENSPVVIHANKVLKMLAKGMEEEFEVPDTEGLNFEERKQHIISYISYLKDIENGQQDHQGVSHGDTWLGKI